MAKWMNSIRSRIMALTSAKTNDAGWQETAATVYVGDIYAVLLRDPCRAPVSAVRGHRLDNRRDAGWPFIR